MSKKNYYENTRFSKRIIVRFIALIAAMLVLFAVFSFALTRMNATLYSAQTMDNTGSLITGLLDDKVKAYAGQLTSAVSDPMTEKYIVGLNTENISENAEKLAEILDGAVARGTDGVISAWAVSDGSGILVGNDGTVLSDGEYNLADKYWYKKYISGGLNYPRYICTGISSGLFNAEETAVTIIVPLISEGYAYAFCGLEVRADSIFSALSSYTFNSGSYPIVCYESVMIYTPSSPDFSEKFSLSDPPLVNTAAQTSISSGTVDSYVSSKGGSVYYYRKTSSVSGWNIIVLFDSAEINGNVYRTFAQQLAVLFCLAALITVFGINMFKRESAGLNELCSCTEEIAAGNLNYRINAEGSTEISKASENINKIAEIMQAKNAVISSFDTSDQLTGLNNRVSLYDYMNDLIRTREPGRSRFAVMFMDVDNFKWINETLGHTYGDEVLAAFGGELKRLSYHVFRFSGDEFVIVQEFDEDPSAVQDVIDRLRVSFDKPLDIMNDNIYVKFSIGVSVYPDDDTTPDMLLRDAEMALNRAKKTGKNRAAFYTNSQKDKCLYNKAALAHSLNEALKNGELLLHYQPIISTKTCDIHGFEVLLRWYSPEFGVVPPAEFIDVAEESGAIIQIGTWIFESACRTLKQINETLDPNIIMSINVSPVQLKRENYIEHVKRVIDITRVDPKNIQLEITESTLIDFTDSKNNVIGEINSLGISLALDDFGTGYSSLNYLKNFPIKCLKIDKSFIDEINNNHRDYAITDSIIDLVHSLGIHTIAEGIEKVDQYDFLADMKCDYIQGFLMSKPLDEAAAIEFVEMYDALHKPDKTMLEENERKLANERRSDEQNRTDREKAAENSGTEEFSDGYIISE